MLHVACKASDFEMYWTPCVNGVSYRSWRYSFLSLSQFHFFALIIAFILYSHFSPLIIFYFFAFFVSSLIEDINNHKIVMTLPRIQCRYLHQTPHPLLVLTVAHSVIGREPIIRSSHSHSRSHSLSLSHISVLVQK